MEFDFDFTADTGDTMDEARAGPGWHLATLIKVEEDPENGKLLTSWRIDSAPYVGSVISEKYNNPALAATQEEMIGQSKRIRIWAIRVGLIDKDAAGKKVKVDPIKAVGVKRVLHLVKDSYTRNDGKTMDTVKIEYAGVFSLDRAEIPAEDRKRLGLPALEGQEAEPSRNGKPKGKTPAPTGSLLFDPTEV